MLAEWTKRLGLQDWAISLEVGCDPSDMRIQDSLGCTTWEESTKSAMIQIVDPEQVGELTRTFDLEQILVHELLHLKTSLLATRDNNETLTDRVLHQLIDDIARAMIDIKKTERSKNG